MNRDPDEVPDDMDRTDDPLALFEAEDATGSEAEDALGTDRVQAVALPLAPSSASVSAPPPAPAPAATDRLATPSPSAPAHTPEPPPPAPVPPAPPSSPMAAGGPAAPEAPSPAGRPIALDTLIARHTPVHWPEAVAVVEAACAGLVLPDGSTRLAPDLTGIRLHADGTVGVSDGAPGESSVVRLARTLQALLPARSTPAPLREMATTWIAATERQALPAFAAELAYFARPEGRALVQALYERASAAPGSQPGATEPPREHTPAPRVPPRRRPPVWLLPAAAALSALAAGGVWYADQAPAAMLSMAGATAGATAAAPTADDAGTEGSGAGPANPVGTASQPAPPPANPRDIPLRPAGVAGGRPPAQAGNTSASTTLLSPPPPATVAPPWMAFVPVPPRVSSGDTGAATPPIVDGSRIYTNRDPDVIPPALVYPQLQAPPDHPDPTVAINTMEVVVGEDGRVQTVQLISTPQRMNDMMLLSAAKVWRFAPASLYGEPVRYRMRVSWATTP